MQLEKLSYNVIRKTNRLIRQIILCLCVLAGVAVLAIVLAYTVQDNSKQVKLYRSQIDNVMSEKTAFINTVAAGAASGTAAADYYAYVDTMVGEYEDVSAVYLCMMDEDAIYKDGLMTYMSGGWVPDEDFMVSERSWYIGAMASDGVYVSEPYVDEQSGNLCITLAKMVRRDGEVIGVAGLDMYMDDLVALIEASYDGGNYVFLTSAEGTILAHPSEEIVLKADESTSVSEALDGRYEKVCKQELKNHLIMDYSGGLKFAISNQSEITGWNVVAVISLAWKLVLVLIVVVLALVVGILIGKLAKHRLLHAITPMFAPLEELSSNVSRISRGELDYTFSVDEQSQEVHELSVALNDTMGGLKHYISQITDTVTAISQKDLDFAVNGDYTGDYEKIKEALQNIVEVLNESFAELNSQAGIVLQYSGQLADTSESVAQTATSQSEAVLNASGQMERLKEDMEKIVGIVNSIRANTAHTNESLSQGNEEMAELVQAMDEIADCYKEIAGFVSEINEIASQTKMLALNASIEAARAGESGKGFAVVADEIGALSGSSSESSTRISEAITKSLSSVEKGKELVSRTGKTIADGVGCSAENAQMVGKIVESVKTQEASLTEITAELQAISSMVENNAASAQENSAISTHLGECAKGLMDTIAEFQLKK